MNQELLERSNSNHVLNNEVDSRAKSEVGLIEAAIAAYPCVSGALVTERFSASGEVELAAYFVTEANCPLTIAPLNAYLTRALPELVLPKHLVHVAELPSGKDGSNGSLDQSALSQMDAAETPAAQPTRKPATELEERVLAVVRETVRNPDITLDDNFFTAGGHSLLGTQFVMRARSVFSVKITLRDIFEAETVGEIAARIEELIMEEIDGLSESDAARLANGAVA